MARLTRLKTRKYTARIKKLFVIVHATKNNFFLYNCISFIRAH